MDAGVIPLIDFDSCGVHVKHVSPDDVDNVGKQITEAFSTVGFCYIKNHGIPEQMIADYLKVSKSFFDLPRETKATIARGNEKSFGWSEQGREHINPDKPADLKEVFNYVPTQDRHNWPSEKFHEATKEMYSQCAELMIRILDTLSIGLGLEPDFMRNAHQFIGKKGNTSIFRTLYYPPLPPESEIKPGQIRLGEHSDYGSMTLLYQDDVGGLEVKLPCKGYVPATPIPGTFILNIGDLMQRWTSDKLLATKHRVCIPEAAIKKTTPRQSFVLFGHPDEDFECKCLDGSDKYEPVNALDYLLYKIRNTYPES